MYSRFSVLDGRLIYRLLFLVWHDPSLHVSFFFNNIVDGNSSSRSRIKFFTADVVKVFSQIDIGTVLLTADVVIVLLAAECSSQQIW